MPRKLTNEEVDERLIEKKIKRITNYVNNHQRVNWQCEVCNFIWTTAFLKIMEGTAKCPHCNATRLNNNIVDERLKNRNMKRLNDCYNTRTKIKWECETCDYIWQARPSDVLNGTGCPQCAGNIKITNKIIDEHIKYKKIKRLSNYIGAHHKVTWQCEVCDNVWETVSSQILNRNHGCPKCGHKSRTFTNEDVDYILQNRNIKRLGNYINYDTKINFQCLKENCNHIWLGIPHNIIRGSSCPKCAGLLKLTNEVIDNRIKGRNIIRLDNIISSSTKIKWQCEICDCEWSTTPTAICNGNGCPKCSAPGMNEKLIYTLLKNNNISFNYQLNIKNIDNTAERRFLDFYFSELNVAIEYNGIQHYTPAGFGSKNKEKVEENFIKQQARDLYIEQFCQNHNIQLIWIDGRKYSGRKLENYLLNDLIPNKILNEKINK